MNFSTAQEEFWFGEFGNEYISRANTKEYLASNLNFFSRAFNKIQKPNSLIEFGANVGFNKTCTNSYKSRNASNCL